MSAETVPEGLPEKWHKQYRECGKIARLFPESLTGEWAAQLLPLFTALADAERRAAQAEAERDRLRAALERIGSLEWGVNVEQAPSIARAALDRPEAGT
jgi:hypothetical protein